MLTEEKNPGAFWKMKCSLTHRFIQMRCRCIPGKKIRPGSAPPGIGPCTGNCHSLGRYSTHNLLESVLIEEHSSMSTVSKNEFA